MRRITPKKDTLYDISPQALVQFPIDSVSFGEILTKAGFRDAVMLDSGASTSLASKNESVVALMPAKFDTGSNCVTPKK